MLASDAPCSSISKNQMKSLKPGHLFAKILLFRTHYLWNFTILLILMSIWEPSVTSLLIKACRVCTSTIVVVKGMRVLQVCHGFLLFLKCRLRCLSELTERERTLNVFHRWSDPVCDLNPQGTWLLLDQKSLIISINSHKWTKFVVWFGGDQNGCSIWVSGGNKRLFPIKTLLNWEIRAISF